MRKQKGKLHTVTLRQIVSWDDFIWGVCNAYTQSVQVAFCCQLKLLADNAELTKQICLVSFS